MLQNVGIVSSIYLIYTIQLAKVYITWIRCYSCDFDFSHRNLVPMPACHCVVAGSLHETIRLHVGLDLWQLLKSLCKSLQLREVVETGGLKLLVLIQHLIKMEVWVSYIRSTQKRFVPKKILKSFQPANQFFQVAFSQLIKLGVVEGPDGSITHVHHPLCQHVRHSLHGLITATQSMFPGDVSQNGIALCYLDITINVVWKVGKVKS